MRVLVTGAASGIGKAVCLRLAKDGIATGRPPSIGALDIAQSSSLSTLICELTALGAHAIPIRADLAKAETAQQAVSETVTAFGGLDGLVSNAGVNCPEDLLTLSAETWDRLFAINTRALWLLGQAAHPALRESRGAIVATASMSGSYPHAHLGAYAASKAAVIMLAKVMAQEFGPDGIRVNTVSPGMVRTGMTEQVYKNNEIANTRNALVPLGRVAEPEEIADTIAFLLRHDARYISGHDLVVDGGLTGNHLGRLPGLSQITAG